MISLFRRDTIPFFASLITARATAARAEPVRQIIPLWPGLPPGGGSGPSEPERLGRTGAISHVHTPKLIVHRPAYPNGMAVIVAGGGGYRSIEVGKESAPAARWLMSQGVTAFQLVYRLPDDGWPRNATFMDATRAIRVVRAAAAGFGIDSNRVGVLGFSAGAHLAGMAAVGATLGAYAPVDGADALSARPNFAALIYPVLTMMPPWNRTKAFGRLLGDNASDATCAAYSVERQVDGTCPPIFLAQAADDPISPVENTTLMFAALRQANLLPEMHIFQRGGHGWGMGTSGSEVAAWSSLYAKWIAQLI